MCDVTVVLCNSQPSNLVIAKIYASFPLMFLSIMSSPSVYLFLLSVLPPVLFLLDVISDNLWGLSEAHTFMSSTPAP